MTDRFEPCKPSTFGFEAIHRRGLEVATAGMADMIDTARDRPFAPDVKNVEGQGGVRLDGRVQRLGWAPSAEPDAGRLSLIHI